MHIFNLQNYLTRRDALAGLLAAVATPALAQKPLIPSTPMTSTVTTGAAALARDGFRPLAGQRIGLITNQTGRIGASHLVDVLTATPGIKLAAILAPEHGFRGQAEAGAKVGDDRDKKTGLPVLSLYGATRKPTPSMLKGLDVLVFDIQDVGVRSYTYISTMGLAMQAASEARIPFVVLDRPNPLGGNYVSGYVLEQKYKSFVGQYPIPIVHGMTVAELAIMIRAERWLPGVEKLDLSVAKVEGWTRSMLWPQTGLPWVATSPNVPTFDASLVYPGIGLVGECLVNEGRGTPTPFSLFGAPWLDAKRAAATLTAAGLPGVRFTAETYTPRGIANVAADPRFENQSIQGVRVTPTDLAKFQPLETGIHALVELHAQSKVKRAPLFPSKLAMFHLISGTAELHSAITAGRSADTIIASWQSDVARFTKARAKHLLY